MNEAPGTEPRNALAEPGPWGRGGRAKSEIRNPKSEGSPNSEIRISAPTPVALAHALGVPVGGLFGFRSSDFLRISGFTDGPDEKRVPTNGAGTNRFGPGRRRTAGGCFNAETQRTQRNAEERDRASSLRFLCVLCVSALIQAPLWPHASPPCGFRPSDFLRISDFGFRIS